MKYLHFISLFILSTFILSCRYSFDPTSGGGGTIPDRLTIPGGRIINNCNQTQDSNSNACIYDKNPVAQKGQGLSEKDLGSQLTQLQTYAVNIVGTVGGLLKNSTYDVNLALLLIPGQRAKLSSNGKWTTPYSELDFSTEQAMTYYWLMYQKYFMETNASGWYATDKAINVEVAADSPFCAYWSPLENKIKLCTAAGLSAEIITHEAGHANFEHSVEGGAEGRPGATGTAACRTHQSCKYRKSVCDLTDTERRDPGGSAICCLNEKGCLFAINEGQADFHAAVLFPDRPAVGELISNSLRGVTGCGLTSGPSRNPDEANNETAYSIFNECERSYGNKGEIHLVGILYNSIWWEIYRKPETDQKEILKIFTEHLPILDWGDTFETAGIKIVNLARQMFEGEKGIQYANIIREEFERRNLNVSVQSNFVPSVDDTPSKHRNTDWLKTYKPTFESP